MRSSHHVKDQWWVTRIRSRMFVFNKPQLDQLAFAEVGRKDVIIKTLRIISLTELTQVGQPIAQPLPVRPKLRPLDDGATSR
jgi:hypothetical protein